MDPKSARNVGLLQGREGLARAIARLDQQVRRAGEIILGLRHEKEDLEARVADVNRLLELERANSAQLERLTSSSSSEAGELQQTVENLRTKLAEQDAVLREQLEVVGTLEEQLQQSRDASRQSEEATERLRQEIERLTALNLAETERSQALSAERDTLKNALYESERQDAMYVTRLTAQEQQEVTETVERILSRLADIEAGIDH